MAATPHGFAASGVLLGAGPLGSTTSSAVCGPRRSSPPAGFSRAAARALRPFVPRARAAAQAALARRATRQFGWRPSRRHAASADEEEARPARASASALPQVEGAVSAATELEPAAFYAPQHRGEAAEQSDEAGDFGDAAAEAEEESGLPAEPGGTGAPAFAAAANLKADASLPRVNDETQSAATKEEKDEDEDDDEDRGFVPVAEDEGAADATGLALDQASET